MISGFIVKKKEMEVRFLSDGTQVAVTRCQADPLKITKVGDDRVQVAYGSKKRINKSVAGFLAKNKLEIKPQHFKEFKLVTDEKPAPGSDISIDKIIAVGDLVRITGTTKGRGFAGVIKRHGFQRQPVTGGQSDRVRAPGAIGAQTPGKVIKGKKMPGHMGNTPKTVTGLKVIDVSPSEIIIKGSLPGHINSYLLVRK